MRFSIFQLALLSFLSFGPPTQPVEVVNRDGLNAGGAGERRHSGGHHVEIETIVEEKTISCLICRLKTIGYLHVLDIGDTEGKLVGAKEYQVLAISLY